MLSGRAGSSTITLLLVVAVSLMVGCVASDSFDRDGWDSGSPRLRNGLAQELVETQRLIGVERVDVHELLGEPDSSIVFEESNLGEDELLMAYGLESLDGLERADWYSLGTAPGAFEPGHLHVFYDSADGAAEARVSYY